MKLSTLNKSTGLISLDSTLSADSEDSLKRVTSDAAL